MVNSRSPQEKDGVSPLLQLEKNANIYYSPFNSTSNNNVLNVDIDTTFCDMLGTPKTEGIKPIVKDLNGFTIPIGDPSSEVDAKAILKFGGSPYAKKASKIPTFSG